MYGVLFECLVYVWDVNYSNGVVVGSFLWFGEDEVFDNIEFGDSSEEGCDVDYGKSL